MCSVSGLFSDRLSRRRRCCGAGSLSCSPYIALAAHRPPTPGRCVVHRIPEALSPVMSVLSRSVRPCRSLCARPRDALRRRRVRCPPSGPYLVRRARRPSTAYGGVSCGGALLCARCAALPQARRSSHTVCVHVWVHTKQDARRPSRAVPTGRRRECACGDPPPVGCVVCLHGDGRRRRADCVAVRTLALRSASHRTAPHRTTPQVSLLVSGCGCRCRCRCRCSTVQSVSLAGCALSIAVRRTPRRRSST